MSPAIRNQSLLPVLWAMIAFQSTLGNAEIEPRRLAAPIPRVNLLPPEMIEPDSSEPEANAPFSEGPGAAQRLALREETVVGQTEDGGPAVSIRFLSRIERTRAALLILCAGLAAGGLGLAFMHRHTDNRAVRAMTSGAESGAVEILKPLIANAYLLIEEPLIMPRMARLHGRPMVSERYRLDAVHALSDPHFTRDSRAASLETDGIHWVSAAEPVVKEPSYRRYGPSPLKRAPATVEGETQ